MDVIYEGVSSKHMNTHIQNRLLGIQQTLIAHHLGGAGLPNAVIGNERETLIREFLSKVFPGQFRFGTGAITDSQNRISGQADVVIELPFEPSFPMPTTSDRLYLAESVGAVIEVKSNLSTQWTQLINTTRQIKTLNRNLIAIMTVGTISRKIPVFAVGYTGYRTVQAIQDKLAEHPENERPDGVLVINPGSFVGYDITATGCWGLYGFIAAIQIELGKVKAADSNLLAYAQP